MCVAYNLGGELLSSMSDNCVGVRLAYQVPFQKLLSADQLYCHYSSILRIMQAVFILPQWPHFTIVIHEENVKRCLACFGGVDGEICLHVGKDDPLHPWSVAMDETRIKVCLGQDLGHVRTVWDVIIVTENVDRILPGNCGGVVNIS